VCHGPDGARVAVLTLLLVAVLAGLLPARRALKIDPRRRFARSSVELGIVHGTLIERGAVRGVKARLG
jgi:hypothetical protein